MMGKNHQYRIGQVIEELDLKQNAGYSMLKYYREKSQERRMPPSNIRIEKSPLE